MINDVSESYMRCLISTGQILVENMQEPENYLL